MSYSVSDDRYYIYASEPNGNTYKGYKLKGEIREKPGKAQLTFSNGLKNFTVTEDSIENAFIKAFNIIDNNEK